MRLSLTGLCKRILDKEPEGLPQNQTVKPTRAVSFRDAWLKSKGAGGMDEAAGRALPMQCNAA